MSVVPAQQGKVISCFIASLFQAEQGFLDVQAERRTCQHEMGTIHSKLKEIHAQLDKVQRGDERYLHLLTEEYEIMKGERDLQSKVTYLEQRERDKFSSLSSAVRESHERERTRNERTKYWAVIGSVVGAMLGILGTSINNYLRMRELRGLVKESTAGGVEIKAVVAKMSETMKTQHNQLQKFVKDLTGLLGPLGMIPESGLKNLSPVKSSVSMDTSPEQFQSETQAILDTVGKQGETLSKEMNHIKSLLAASKIDESEGKIIYVGPEMEAMLEKTESNLEAKMKLNGLWTVAFIYGAFALTLPVLYSIFKGS